MASVFWAEWVIARFTDQSRAASIVGDLLEAATEQGTSWFWLSLAGVLLSLLWRHFVAFVAAFLCLSLLRALPMPVYAPLHGMPPAHEPTGFWIPIFAVLGGIGMLLWVAAPYATIRYGFRDRFAQLLLAFCVPITAAIWYWWIPAVVVTCIALAFSILVSSVVFVQRRRPLLALALALAIGYLGVRFTLYLAAGCLEVASPSVSLTLRVYALVPLIGAAVLTTGCAWMHRILLCRDQRCFETDSLT